MPRDEELDRRKQEWRAKRQELKALSDAPPSWLAQLGVWTKQTHEIWTKDCPSCDGPDTQRFDACPRKFNPETFEGRKVCQYGHLYPTWLASQNRTQQRRGRMIAAGIQSEELLGIIAPARSMADALPRLENIPAKGRDLYLRAPRQVMGACQSFLNERKRHLVLCGDKGTWKTTAAACVVAETDSALWLPMSKVQPSASFDDIRPKVMASRLLVLSDLGRETMTEAHRSILSGIITERDDDNRPVLVTTNLTRVQLKERYGDAAMDRLERGLIHEAVGLSLREALEKK